jgi:hypothetical protein
VEDDDLLKAAEPDWAAWFRRRPRRNTGSGVDEECTNSARLELASLAISRNEQAFDSDRRSGQAAAGMV